jgi:hypothetical protein
VIGRAIRCSACALAAVIRGSAREIVLVNRTRKTAQAVATDMRYGIPVGRKVEIEDGDYDDLAGAGVVLITSGVNERRGGATDRGDPQGRLKLLDKNAEIYRQIIPEIVKAAPDAVLVVVTDPPDPLADVAREIAPHSAVLSMGTYIDSQRFRVHLGKYFGVDPAHVEAQVIGDHGSAQVFLWSSARVGGVAVAALLKQRGEQLAKEGNAGARRALRQHHHHRGARREPIWHWDRVGTGRRDGAQGRARGDPDRQLSEKIRGDALAPERCGSHRRYRSAGPGDVGGGAQRAGEKRGYTKISPGSRPLRGR